MLREHLPLIAPRVTGIVSRGGSLLAKWMIHHGKQNPMYELFDEISAIMREYDVTYSLGDGLRPGCLADATDAAQLAELHTLGELVQRARDAGVQVMVEGPGHVPFDQIALQHEAPAASSATTRRSTCSARWSPTSSPATTTSPAPSAPPRRRAHGAAMLCYVTPKEHVGLPKARGREGGLHRLQDRRPRRRHRARHPRRARSGTTTCRGPAPPSTGRKQFELAFDGETARALHDEDLEVDTDFCAMCGHDWCSMRISKEIQAFASGKDADFQPERRAMPQPGRQRRGPRAARSGAPRACRWSTASTPATATTSPTPSGRAARAVGAGSQGVNGSGRARAGRRMTHRLDAMRAHPAFPWLDAGDPSGLRAFLTARGWLDPGERMIACTRAGEGNMNLTLRVRTERRSMVLKQARPWVEKYDHIEAPWERSLSERWFYDRVASIPGWPATCPACSPAIPRPGCCCWKTCPARAT